MNYYNEIKNELINNEINRRVKNYSINKSDLDTYYNVGKLLVEAQGGEERAKYGDSLIKEYSQKLTKELGKGYNITSLKRMRKYYLIIQKGATVWHQLTWSHYMELLPLKDINKIEYYIEQCRIFNLSRNKLRERIKNKEYERLPDETKNKLITKDVLEVKDLVPSPILIRNKNNIEVITEKTLHKLILEDISSFMKELGNGYSYIDGEYKIKIGNTYNYIDLLLYNIEYNCYVVVELKVTELKKEHIGQIQVYMNYVDKNIKKINHNKTIGIIICKRDNSYVIEYCSDNRIITREYEFI